MSSPEQVLSEFIDDWNAGRRPRVLDFLERVAAGTERDALAGQIGAWLEVAPTPAYDEATRAGIRQEPRVRAVLDSGDAGLWPSLLPSLRERRGLGVRDLAARVVEAFGLRAADEDRTVRYLESLERGELAPAQLSRRLLDALGRALGVGGGALADAGVLGTALRPSAAGGTLFRSDAAAEDRVAEDVEVLSRAAFAAAPAPMDELDRLFCGGPDA